MKITRLDVHFHNERGFSIKLFKHWEFEEHQYLFNIKAFGRDFGWGIDK